MMQIQPSPTVGRQLPARSPTGDGDRALRTDCDECRSSHGQGTCDPGTASAGGWAEAVRTVTRSRPIGASGFDRALAYDLCLTVACLIFLTWATVARTPTPADLGDRWARAAPDFSWRAPRAPVDDDEGSAAADDAPEIDAAPDR